MHVSNNFCANDAVTNQFAVIFSLRIVRQSLFKSRGFLRRTLLKEYDDNSIAKTSTNY